LPRAALAGTLAVGTMITVATRLTKNTPSAAATPGMIRMAGGSFRMGLEQEELNAACSRYPKGCAPEAQDEYPSRAVTVAPFELDQHEVTNEDFAAFLTTIAPSLNIGPDPDHDNAPRYVNYGLRPGESLLLYDDWILAAGIEISPDVVFHVRPAFEKLPVTLVTWFGARLYCKNAMRRLPTEAEWELAAGGREKRSFPWGENRASCDTVHIASGGFLDVDAPEHCDNARKIPFPVMTAAQDVTPEGIYDLAGNVAEWVDDDNSLNQDEEAYARRLRAETPSVFRGGSINTSFMARTTSRGFRLPFNDGSNLGFRCAKSLPRNQ
jgi:formylglycine-generating enzyme required for sulfatase activity